MTEIRYYLELRKYGPVGTTIQTLKRKQVRSKEEGALFFNYKPQHKTKLDEILK